MRIHPIAFGQCDGRVAQLFPLESETLRAHVTDYGGALVSLEAPDRQGRRAHVVLGFDDVADYATAKGSFGALLGRTANRLARGAHFDLNALAYKVYVRRPEDLARIQTELAAALGARAQIIYLQADICRQDLLVEIEATGICPLAAMA